MGRSCLSACVHSRPLSRVSVDLDISIWQMDRLLHPPNPSLLHTAFKGICQEQQALKPYQDMQPYLLLLNCLYTNGQVATPRRPRRSKKSPKVCKWYASCSSTQQYSSTGQYSRSAVACYF
jgi:hypothetical protein